MSDNTDQQSLSDHPVYGAPGCGLATYGCVLMMFFLLGMTGLVVSSMALLQSGFTRPPFALAPGNQVKVWRLQPMRDAGLLDLTESPLYYHDESSTGVTACAITDSHVLRLDAGQAWKVPYSAIRRLEIISKRTVRIALMTLHNGEDIPCMFLSGEGVERFAEFVRQAADITPTDR